MKRGDDMYTPLSSAPPWLSSNSLVTAKISLKSLRITLLGGGGTHL